LALDRISCFLGEINQIIESSPDVTLKTLQEARALLGKLEYQRGNLEGALRVFDGIDLQAAIQRLQSSSSEKPQGKKGRTQNESASGSQHAASLVLEAIYLKAKSLQKLGKFTGIIYNLDC